MKRVVEHFISNCLTCQQVKVDYQLYGGLLKPLAIPEWKLECVTCDFGVGLPNYMKKNDFIWAVVDRLTKSAHFIPVESN